MDKRQLLYRFYASHFIGVRLNVNDISEFKVREKKWKEIFEDNNYAYLCLDNYSVFNDSTDIVLEIQENNSNYVLFSDYYLISKLYNKSLKTGEKLIEEENRTIFVNKNSENTIYVYNSLKDLKEVLKKFELFYSEGGLRFTYEAMEYFWPEKLLELQMEMI